MTPEAGEKALGPAPKVKELENVKVVKHTVEPTQVASQVLPPPPEFIGWEVETRDEQNLKQEETDEPLEEKGENRDNDE